MLRTKDRIVRLIRARAQREVVRLAGELARATTAHKEVILAALEAERWLAESCTDALGEL